MMTDQHDLNIARDMGEMKADVRTVKHDLANIQHSVNILSDKINTLTSSQARGLGFFAGAAMIVTMFGGVLLMAARALFGNH